MAEIMASKIVVDIYIGSSRKVHVPFVVESCSCVASEWLSNRNCRMWLLQKLFGDIDCDTNQLAQFQITSIHQQSNGMADALAKAESLTNYIEDMD
ncbi:hypothetical protein PVK06_045807 [Gossypium arboreum]|uniref:RNase H type-1 domain-containing protein n=1 Tax=Gossypium arboreum TaxID=29729 RepID=A0ABR0MVH7_GOSAR|nr:hypothetical protein PVK06_045807 [Gossypium arboreum]